MKQKHVLLIIDKCEGNLISLWKQRSDYNYTIASCALPVADLWLCISDEPIPVPPKNLLFGVVAPFDESSTFPPTEPTVVIERKALADLESSYQDGRYREQKERLKTMSCKVVYLVEGYIGQEIQDKTRKKRLLSTFINTEYRDGIPVHQSASIEDTYEYISHLCSQYAEAKVGEGSQKRTKYTDTVKLSKKANLTPDKGLELMLAQVPGVSTAMGRAIAAQHGGMHTLCRVLDKEGPKALSEIQVHGKRLGNVRSERIYNFLQ